MAQLVSLQATGSGEGLVAADVAAGVEVGAGRAGGDPQSMIIIIIIMIMIITLSNCSLSTSVKFVGLRGE